MKLNTTKHFDDIRMHHLQDAYYFIKSAHLKKEDAGIDMKRIIVEKNGPYITFPGSDEPEWAETIFGSFIKIELEDS